MLEQRETVFQEKEDQYLERIRRQEYVMVLFFFIGRVAMKLSQMQHDWRKMAKVLSPHEMSILAETWIPEKKTLSHRNNECLCEFQTMSLKVHRRNTSVF